MISLYETIKFATVDLVRDPQPTVDDFFLSMAQAYTGAMLAAPLRRGIPSWTRELPVSLLLCDMAIMG